MGLQPHPQVLTDNFTKPLTLWLWTNSYPQCTKGDSNSQPHLIPVGGSSLFRYARVGLLVYSHSPNNSVRLLVETLGWDCKPIMWITIKSCAFVNSYSFFHGGKRSILKVPSGVQLVLELVTGSSLLQYAKVGLLVHSPSGSVRLLVET